MTYSLKLKLYDSNLDESKSLTINTADPDVTTAKLSTFLEKYNSLFNSDFDLITATLNSAESTVIYPEA